MKQTKGRLHGSDVELLGKVTLKGKSILNRSDYIYVGNVKTCPMGYLASITNETDVSGTKPIVSDVNINLFNEGDVVLITKEGVITFLYEMGSHQNAVMATELCNHRCIMCPQPPVLKEQNKTDFNLKLISLFDKATTEVGITGGEPTMIGDDLFNLINAIKKHCPKAAITILSNGVKFADKAYAMKLAQCGHPNLQVDVPLFSDIPEIHNAIVGAKTFYKSIQGLYNLALFNIRIGIRFVVHRKTYDRMVKFADFIYHNLPFVSQVAFMQMETVGMAEKNIEDLWIDPFDYNNELKEAVLLLNDRRMNPLIYNAQLCVLPEEIRPFAMQSISDWKDVFVEECEGCSLKSKCAGFFAGNKEHLSTHIHKIESISENDISCVN